MKRLLLVHNLVHGQSVVHELDDKDFAVELVEGDPETDDQGEMDVELSLIHITLPTMWYV